MVPPRLRCTGRGLKQERDGWGPRGAARAGGGSAARGRACGSRPGPAWRRAHVAGRAERGGGPVHGAARGPAWWK
jgi:hypothetical protein